MKHSICYFNKMTLYKVTSGFILMCATGIRWYVGSTHLLSFLQSNDLTASGLSACEIWLLWKERKYEEGKKRPMKKKNNQSKVSSHHISDHPLCRDSCWGPWKMTSTCTYLMVNGLHLSKAQLMLLIHLLTHTHTHTHTQFISYANVAIVNQTMNSMLA